MGDISRRGEQLHKMQMRVEEARLAVEEARLAAEKKLAAERARVDAFLAMSGFFSNLNRSLDSSKGIVADIARNVGALLDEGQGASEVMALSHINV